MSDLQLTPKNTPEKNPDAGAWVFLAMFNENMIDKEHTLTNHRMSWMMATQGFLFGTFCLLLNSAATNKGAQPTTAPSSAGTTTIELILVTIPILGLVVVIAAGFGILAAQAMAQCLEAERSKYQGILRKLFDYDAMPDFGTRRSGWLSWTRVGGVWPPRFILVGIGILWIVALFNRFGVVLTDRGSY